MSIAVFTLVLCAAALHATWNAIVKGAGDTLSSMVLVTSSAGAIAAAALPFLPQPAPASWPFIAASVVLQLGYFALVIGAYRAADMSRTYPLMRGAAPMLVAAASTTLFGESLPAAAWAGIGLICTGIVSLTLSARRTDHGTGTALALLNAAVIAAYTLVDGAGVRRSGAPAAYTLWIFLLTALPFAGWVIARQRAAFTLYCARNLHLGLIGGFGTVASYGVALWAMTVAPVAVVAALRETSILFATAIAALVLRERVTLPRLAAIAAIALGAVTLRLA